MRIQESLETSDVLVEFAVHHEGTVAGQQYGRGGRGVFVGLVGMAE